MKVMEVEGLCKKYPGFTLENVSFSLERGKIIGFVGRNGAGKSTTLNSIFGLVHPDSGEIRVFEKDMEKNEMEIKQRIGFVSAGMTFYSNKKMKTIAKVTASFYDSWDEGAYEKYMRRFRLEEGKTPAQLSAGMKVKFALTLALSHNAELLILDEPTSGLDPVSRDDLIDTFLGLCEEGKTILFSTHITSDLDKCADDILYIKNGKLLAQSAMGSFVDSYRIVEFEGGALPDETCLIGRKRSKDGFSALVKTENAQRVGAEAKAATLEDIMVHIEKEEEGWEEC